MKVKITPAKTKKELDLFYDFFSKNLARDFPHYSKKVIDYLLTKQFNAKIFEKEVKARERQIFLAKADAQVVGYLVASYPYGGITLCNWIAVDSKVRRVGIASKLLSEWEKWALFERAHKLQLSTDVRNVDFYKKRGFTLLGKID